MGLTVCVLLAAVLTEAEGLMCWRGRSQRGCRADEDAEREDLQPTSSKSAIALSCPGASAALHGTCDGEQSEALWSIGLVLPTPAKVD